MDPVITQNIRNIVALHEAKRKVEQAEERLRVFVEQSFSVIEPSSKFVAGWHIDAVCEHLEALRRREIKKLIISISPRSMKSTIISVAFPAWLWINNPEEKILASSYTSKISNRDSRKCRNLLLSQWYQANWGSKFKLTKDQNEKGYFENSKGGYRISTSVDGSNTGFGGTVRIYDDANDLKTIDSEVSREEVIDWYDGVMISRNVNPIMDVELCVQQRCHEMDLTGHLLELGGWEHLVIPMEYDGRRTVSAIGWSDPRTLIGELMQPTRIPLEQIENMKQALGPHRFAGQYNQNPTAPEGGLLKREYWRFWNPGDVVEKPVQVRIGPNKFSERVPTCIPAAFEQIVHSWDMAFKDEAHNDYVCGQVWGRVGANIYLLAQRYGHFNFPKTLQEVRHLSNEFPCPEKLVEDAANGPAVIATLRNEIPGLIAVKPEGGKIARANGVSGYCESGNVYLPNPDLYPWVWELIEELAAFPSAPHDDRVDAFTQAAKRMFDSVTHSAVPEFRVQPRAGEPATATHVDRSMELDARWPRWIAVSPGEHGAVVWTAETPTGSLRIYREMLINGMDAAEVGRVVAEKTLLDPHVALINSRRTFTVLMEKSAFAAIEPIGSYAELFESGLHGYDPTSGGWDDRQMQKTILRNARIVTDMVEIEDGAWDRLRDLLRFSPPDFEELPYDREKAFALADRDFHAYERYMDAVRGVVRGEWPKIRFSSDCKQTIQALGAAKRPEHDHGRVVIDDPFIRSILMAVCAPRSVAAFKSGIKEVAWPRNQPRAGRGMRIA